MLPTREEARASTAGWARDRASRKVLGWTVLVFAAGAGATALLRHHDFALVRPADASCAAGRACAPSLTALAASPATAVAFALWLSLAITGLVLLARCLRRGSTAMRTVGAGLGLLYFGLVGLLVTGLIG